VAAKLRRLGCVEAPSRSAGSHRKWWNPLTRRGSVLPDWGGNDLKLGTVRAAVGQLGIGWHDFEQA